jgi:hypothetical protein
VAASAQVVEFDGGFLERGFWLYAWEVVVPAGATILYAGCTGDSSSANAQSPFNRMGQQVGRAVNSSMLRNHLAGRDVEPQDCTSRLIAYGPVLPEDPAGDMAEHKLRRDVVAGIEKRLAEDLKAAGYDVVNMMASTKPLDENAYADVRAAFAAHFPRLGSEA